MKIMKPRNGENLTTTQMLKDHGFFSQAIKMTGT